MDLVERAHDYRVFLDLPGTTAEDILLDISNGVLRLSARVDPSRFVAEDPRPREFKVGDWQLSLDFGDLILGDELQAVYEDGVLLVTLTKATGRSDSRAEDRDPDRDSDRDSDDPERQWIDLGPDDRVPDDPHPGQDPRD
jgi:HSP20 family molecular chaperone IbpA